MTVEEVPPGPLPKWALEHAVNQARQSISKNENSSSILYLHPNQASRIEALDEIGKTVPVFDRSSHHTIQSLARVIGQDLRMKRAVEVDPVLNEFIHILATHAAENFRFPVIHPDERRKWHRGKTEAIRALHNALISADSLQAWEGAQEALEFSKILNQASDTLGGIHPDLFVLEVTRELEKEAQSTPFTLQGVDGILMLDQDPSLPKMDLRFTKSLLRYLPIHQLCHTGSYRLGHHGLQIEDIFPAENEEDLPDWVPRHTLSWENPTCNVHATPVRLESQTIPMASELISKIRAINNTASVIIVDPSWRKRERAWNRCISSIRSMINPNLESDRRNPTLCSLISDLTIASGNHGFSMEKIRSLGKRGLVNEMHELPVHPQSSEIRPIFHSDVIEMVAMNNHIVGGQGTLIEWLKSLSSKPKDERDSLRREETQWWMLIAAGNLSPLLSEQDRECLGEPALRKGCVSGAELPLSNHTSKADAWLDAYLLAVEKRALLQHDGAISEDPLDAIQFVKKRMAKFNQMARLLDFDVNTTGPNWVERTRRILSGFDQKTSAVRDPNIRIMTPREALGCTADLTILTHLSTEWSMKVQKIPYLSEQDRFKFGISSPDKEIKSARHSIQHLLHSAQEVHVIHATNDDLAPPSFILDEWLAQRSNEGSDQLMIAFDPQGPREQLSGDGKRILLGQPATKKPLSYLGPLSRLELDLADDMASRSPTMPGQDGFLPDLSILRATTPPIKQISHPTSKAKKKPPRVNARWPVIGARNNDFLSASIDPRPIQAWKTDIPQRESRQGHTSIITNRRTWSPYRLNNWLECPRKGWLTDKQNLSEDELTSQDLDSRTYGNLLHGLHHDIMLEVLGLNQGEEFQIADLETRDKSVESSKYDRHEIMMIALTSLSKRAPWLLRSNATSVQKLWMLAGMDTEEWVTWLANPEPMSPRGRVGSIIDMEMRTLGPAPIAVEWSLSKKKEIVIEVPKQLVEKRRKTIPFTATGVIDRVDLVPFDPQGEKWHDEEGSHEVAPLRLLGSGWKPRRMIIIRDLKSKEDFTKPMERHERAIFGELQLALYSRAWEIAHPGDLVIGAGITTLGFDSKHYIELSGHAPDWVFDGSYGEVTRLTHNMFRFADEGPNTESDPFRAWLTHRMAVASNVAHNANSGLYNPTPDESVCRFCSASNICDQSAKGGFSA